jgi:SAM-dependent methyltransferase
MSSTEKPAALSFAMLILDIGCGKKKQDPSAIGLDRQPGSSADVRCDLTHFPWPLKDNCAGRIYLSHFLEHHPDILRAMAEVHRIAQPGAEVIIVTPHYSSPDSYTDPTHLFHLAVRSFDYFERNSFEDFIYPAGGFRILQRRLTFGGNLLLDNLGRMFAAISLDFYEKHLAWVLPARNIICRLAVSKSREVERRGV